MPTQDSFARLKPHTPRTFVPATADLGDWAQIEPLFDTLETRLKAAASANDLEAWLLDASEFYAAVNEEGARRYIAMTCQTDDAEREKRYLHFVENISPRLKPRLFKLS